MYTSELLDHIQAHMRGKPGGGGLEYGTDAQANAIGSSNTSGGAGSGSTNNTSSKAGFIFVQYLVFRTVLPFGDWLFIHTSTNATDDHKYSPLPSADFDIAAVLVSFSAFIFS